MLNGVRDWAGIVAALPEYTLSLDKLGVLDVKTSAKAFAWNVTEGKYYDEAREVEMPVQLAKDMENR